MADKPEQVMDYILKWIGIFSPILALILLLLYAIIAGESTTSYDAVHFPDFFNF